MAHSSSPFGLPEDDLDNPFADSSVTSSSQAHPQPYNYSASTTTDYAAPSGFMSQPSAAYSGPDAASLTQKEEELRKREERLNQREAQLKRDQETMQQSGFKPPNWPKWYPLFHHDIETDIPEAGRSIVRNIYRLWLGVMALLVWNMLACMVLLISHPSNMPNVASDFGVSLIYIFFIGSASLYTWYRPVYMAFQSNAALYFYLFLLFNGMHILFSAYMAVGIPGSGGAGFINLLAVATDAKWVATVFCAIAFGGWVFGTVYSLWMWKAVHAFNSAAGHTFAEAKNEAATMGVRSGAAQGVASAYIRSETGNFGA
ncbi:hypothetical protein HKX48_004971 [Thoreauomyces humboldtii]|nr:hypothetical protein HKX48_004971 [Thoreauomyces humboldtii]